MREITQMLNKALHFLPGENKMLYLPIIILCVLIALGLYVMSNNLIKF